MEDFKSNQERPPNPKSTPSQNKILIRISDTIPKPPKSLQIKHLNESIQSGGGMLIDPNYETALRAWSKGVKSVDWNQQVAESSPVLNDKDKANLYKVGDIIRSLEKAYPKSTTEFREVNPKKGEIKIKELKAGEQISPGNNIVLERRGEKYIVSEEESKDYYSKEYREKSLNFLNNFVEDAVSKYENEEIPDIYEEEPYIPPTIETEPEVEEYTSPQKQSPSPSGNISSTLNRARNFASNRASGIRSAAESQAKQLVKKGLTNLAKSVGPALAQAAGYIAAAGAILMGFIAWLTTVIITIVVWSVGFIIFVAIVLFIINSGAYIVPPGTSLETRGYTIPGDGTPGTGPGEGLPECSGLGKPTNPDIIWSPDRRYAFPMAYGDNMGYSCSRHWDGGLAVDIFPAGSSQGDIFAPTVAYTSGVIDMAYLDNIGGYAIILHGDDGRYYYYAHLCIFYVSEGQRVSAGEVIARSDRTGDAISTPEHIHFAINAPPLTNYFSGGHGNVCPPDDFEYLQLVNRCPISSCF